MLASGNIRGSLVPSISNDDLELMHISSAFDAEWYSGYYQDVELGGFDPAFHFLWLGWRLGRQPAEGLRLKDRKSVV